MLNFDNRAHEIIRSWYIDGKLYYHKVIDLDNPKKGILELRYIDPLKIRKVRQKLGKDSQDPRINRAIKGTALEYEWGNYIDYFLYNPKDICEAELSVLLAICQTLKELKLLQILLHSVPRDYKILTRGCT